MASAFLKRTPGVAPRPTATMIDIGVASPRAQGQAMIRTATALTSAWARRGCGPDHGPDDEGGGGDRHDRRHEEGRDLVGQALDGRAGALRLAHQPYDLGQQGLGAHPLGAHDQRSRCR